MEKEEIKRIAAEHTLLERNLEMELAAAEAQTGGQGEVGLPRCLLSRHDGFTHGENERAPEEGRWGAGY